MDVVLRMKHVKMKVADSESAAFLISWENLFMFWIYVGFGFVLFAVFAVPAVVTAISTKRGHFHYRGGGSSSNARSSLNAPGPGLGGNIYHPYDDGVTNFEPPDTSGGYDS